MSEFKVLDKFIFLNFIYHPKICISSLAFLLFSSLFSHDLFYRPLVAHHRVSNDSCRRGLYHDHDHVLSRDLFGLDRDALLISNDFWNVSFYLLIDYVCVSSFFQSDLLTFLRQQMRK